MRFKTIFWLFNGVVVASFLFVALIPLAVLGSDYLGVFWGRNWILAVVFLIFIGVLDGYFISNWRLFTFLESENWPELLRWLEDRLYEKGRINRVTAGLMINTALSLSRLDAIRRLEKEIRETRPRMLALSGVYLGIPVLLEGDAEKIEAYFAPLADDPRTRRRDWARWCRCFALVSRGRGEDAQGELLAISETRDAPLGLLVFQLLDPLAAGLDEKETEKYRRHRRELVESVTGAAGRKRLARSREDNLMALVLGGLVNESRERLIAETGAPLP